ncbi:MAG: hypothetical protein R3C26_21925 [Calditrichia bacterium]
MQKLERCASRAVNQPGEIIALLDVQRRSRGNIFEEKFIAVEETHPHIDGSCGAYQHLNKSGLIPAKNSRYSTPFLETRANCCPFVPRRRTTRRFSRRAFPGHPACRQNAHKGRIRFGIFQQRRPEIAVTNNQIMVSLSPSISAAAAPVLKPLK